MILLHLLKMLLHVKVLLANLILEHLTILLMLVSHLAKLTHELLVVFPQLVNLIFVRLDLIFSCLNFLQIRQGYYLLSLRLRRMLRCLTYVLL